MEPLSRSAGATTSAGREPRRPAVLVAATLAWLVVAGSGTGAAAGPAVRPSAGTSMASGMPVAEPLRAVDDLGRTVLLDRLPERIVSLAPSNTEILFALGLGERVVGVTTACNYPDGARDKPRVAKFGTVDVEQLVAARPDLVVATGLYAGDTIEGLEELELPVFVIEPPDLPGLLESIRRLGRLTGRNDAAAAIGAQGMLRMEAVAASVAGARHRPRLLYVLSDDLYTAGGGSFLDDLIERAGGHNIAGHIQVAYPRLSSEFVVTADPELILVTGLWTNAAELAGRPGWHAISAVQHGRIFHLADPVLRPGPRAFDGLEHLAGLLHPARFDTGRQPRVDPEAAAGPVTP